MQIITNYFFVIRIYLKILIRDVSYLGMLALSPFLLYVSFQLRELPEEIYRYSITLTLTILAPIFAIILHTFNAAKLFRLHLKPELSQAMCLLFPNLLSAAPLLLPTIFAITSPELTCIFLASLISVSILLTYDRKLIAFLPTLFLPFQNYQISVLYALLPFIVVLIKKTTSRARVVGGIAVFPHHVILPLAAIFITSLPLFIHSKKIYITSYGAGMVDPEFLNPLLVIDAITLQILLVLLPFIVLSYARSVDLKMCDVRLVAGNTAKRRVTAILSATALTTSTTIIVFALLSLSGVLHTDWMFVLHISLASVFANLLIPADPDKSSRSLMSLTLYLVTIFALPLLAVPLLLLVLLCFYDADVKIARWLSEHLY